MIHFDRDIQPDEDGKQERREAREAMEDEKFESTREKKGSEEDFPGVVFPEVVFVNFNDREWLKEIIFREFNRDREPEKVFELVEIRDRSFRMGFPELAELMTDKIREEYGPQS